MPERPRTARPKPGDDPAAIAVRARTRRRIGRFGRAGLVLPAGHDRQDESCPTRKRDRRDESGPKKKGDSPGRIASTNPSDQQGLRGPSGGGDTLGVALGTGGSGGLGPGAVGLLGFGQVRPASCDQVEDARPVSVAVERQKGQGGVEGFGRGLLERAPAAVGRAGPAEEVESVVSAGLPFGGVGEGPGKQEGSRRPSRWGTAGA